MSVGMNQAVGVWFRAARQVELRSESLIPVGPNDVRVRAVASAISQGTEMLVYRGQVPTNLDLDLPTLRGSFEFPVKYGYASAGRVVEVGASVASVRENDLVFVHHPHQSQYVVPADTAVLLPSNVNAEAGVFLANVETAVNVMLDAGIRIGERLVIFGQGVVGLLLTQLARLVGAGLIVTVDPIPLRRQMSLEFGADVALAPDENVEGIVFDRTDGVGADIALEASGQGSALATAIDCLAIQGSVVVCSWYGTKPVTLSLGGAFHRRRLRLISSQVGTVDPSLQPRWDRRRRLAVARDLLARLPVTRMITHRCPIARASEAYELVDRHPDETIQVVLTYEDTGV
jgi:2-desacetyl-2-hydroxyethyl bacteriochlorophyllide A dehydrogenase